MPKSTLLICEDDEGILDVLTTVLDTEEHTIVTANSGDEVLPLVKEHHPDIVLLDLWLPVVSGEELTRQLKKNPETQHIPVIIISASKDTQKVAESAGADCFITKPFDIFELEETVARYLQTPQTQTV